MLIIGNIKFSSVNIVKMGAALDTIPEPVITPFLEEDISPDQTVICLQREYAYINLLDSTSPIKFIGSKQVYSCICAYIYSDIHHLIIHFDVNESINLTDLLHPFRNEKSTKVILFGGNDADESSKRVLNFVMTSLVEASNALKISIVIESQKMMARNKYTPDHQFEIIYNSVISSAIPLYRYFFKESLDMAAFDNDIQSKLRQKNRPGYQVINQQLIKKFTSVLFVTSELSVDSFGARKSSTFNSAMSVFKHELIKQGVTFDKKLFHMMVMDALIRGEINTRSETPENIAALTSMTGAPNAVFDIATGQMKIISRYHYTPNELARNASLFTLQAFEQYTSCYDHKTSIYNYPIFKQDELILLKFMKENYRNKINADNPFNLDEKTLEDLTSDEFVRFYHSCSFDNSDKLPFSLSNKPTLFRPPVSLGNFYTDGIVNNQMSRLLNQLKISNANFNIKRRKYPLFIVDALSFCENKITAEEIKISLEEKGIYSYLISFGEHPHTVCIPAINVENYADKIVMSYEAMQPKPKRS